MKTRLKLLLLALGIVLILSSGFAFRSRDTIKIGILHSLSGTMAISETTLKDVLLMMIEATNQDGGLLGKPLEPIILDPHSDWNSFAEQARELLFNQKVAVVFGCWTSASRKAVLPVFEELNGLLFYPVQYEGEESSRNVFYFGAAPNQQALPAVEYLLKERQVKRFILLGTDYVYPRTTNKILRAFLQQRGIATEDIWEQYTPFAFDNWRGIVSQIQQFATEGKQTAVISTINGDANRSFYQELAKQQINAAEIPVLAFSVSEQELSTLDTQPLVGHLASWNYFMSLDNEENHQFIKSWHRYIKDDTRVVNDPMEAHYIGFQMWKHAVLQAGTTQVDAVRQAMYGQKLKSLSGVEVVMNTNHHLSKPVLVGSIQADGQFKVIWQLDQPKAIGEVQKDGLFELVIGRNQVIKGEAWSSYLPESAKLTADWTYPWVCGGCEKPTYGQLKKK